MKLRSLQVHGFKSFPYPTRVEFHDGITAVVGPNGCGKSNIGDAIRWVLGEQRPSAVRGARMEEVIFQGTVSRKPVNRGSVSMVVSNEDGLLPVPFEEVEIGRTVYRDGGSDYRLNRTACRLRDIVDLCRDTGLGANAYSVIEIRMIDAILSERADERRFLFEEAAGIGKYKDRRRVAVRRLKTSEADLRRIEDVIAEVRTKVRSLARQKGKAQRYEKLQSRRIQVEVTLAKNGLEELDARLSRVDGELKSSQADGVGAKARLRVAEADLEQARLVQMEAERARVESASSLDAVGSELYRVEMEVAVAEERITHGKRRLAQISNEQAGLSKFRTRSDDELSSLRDHFAQRLADIEVVRSNLAKYKKSAAEIRKQREVAQGRVRELEVQCRTVTRRIARIEGDRESARIQAEEMGRRLTRLSRVAREGAGAQRDLRSKGDLFSDRRTVLAVGAQEASGALANSRRRLGLLRERLETVRVREKETEPRLTALEAEADALRRLTATGEGAEALAAAACKAFPIQVLGVLSDFVRVAGPPSARIVDAVLGRFGFALVLRSREDAGRIQQWYTETESAAGLVLLPRERAPESRGALPVGVSATGAGAPWVRALLGGLKIGNGLNPASRSSVSTDAEGEVRIDVRGAIHLLPRGAAGGRLERRERIKSLGFACEAARRKLEDVQAARTELEREYGECEEETRAASERLLEARDEARAAEAEATAHSDRQQRLDRHQEEISRQLEGTRAARDRADDREGAAKAALTRLRQEETALATRLERRREDQSASEDKWERAREAESETAIRSARLENEAERLRGRISDLEETVDRTGVRIAELDRETRDLEEELVRLRRIRRDGQAALQQLFSKRDDAKDVLEARKQALQIASEAVTSAERRVGETRSAERAAADRRHELELRRQDIRNQAMRIGERLEAEWNRPLEALIQETEIVKGPPEDLKTELTGIVGRLNRMGPVNMLAVEEHAEESARLEFLSRQREDLVRAGNDLRSAIRRINETATQLFMGSFEAIRENFRRTFRHLFDGGEANLRLADPDRPLESPVEIHAAPGGKRTQRIDLLSGGERALTALSLLFGIYLVKPSPFCILDEVDAPLDESNIGRFIRLLQGFKAQTQFVVITHNPRTIEAADWIYGVTMEEPGVSSIVGVRLEATGPVG